MKNNAFLIFLFVMSLQTTIAQNVTHEKQHLFIDANQFNDFIKPISSEEKYLRNLPSYYGQTSFKTRLLFQKLDSLITIQKQNSGVWESYQKFFFEYNTNGQAFAEHDFVSDSTGWKNYSETRYDYNALDQIEKDSFMLWVADSNEFNSTLKRYFAYYPDGNLKSYVSYFRDFTYDQWFPNWKQENTYNSNGQLIELLESEFIGFYQSWYPKTKKTYSYDGSLNRVVEVISDWDFALSYWKPKVKLDRYYDATGNNTKVIESSLDSDSTWSFRSQSLQQFNSSNQLTELLYQNYQYSDSVWVNRIRIDYSYDSDGNQIDAIWNYWNYNAQEWVIQTNHSQAYNNNYIRLEILFPPNSRNYEYHSNYQNMLLSYKLSYRDAATNTWDDQRSVEYFYSDQYVNSTIDPTGFDYCVYPNPVSNNLYFSFPNTHSAIGIQIYDMTGRLIISVDVANNESIDVSFISPGVYFYKAEIDNKNYDGKIIKL